MQTQYMNAFIYSTMAVFETHLGCGLKRGNIFLKPSFQPQYEVNAIMTLHGPTNGIVVLGLARATAQFAADAVLPERAQDLAEVTDAVQMIARRIVGRTEEMLEHFDVTVDAPEMFVGRSRCLPFPVADATIAVPFTSEWGPVILEVCLVRSEVICR